MRTVTRGAQIQRTGFPNRYTNHHSTNYENLRRPTKISPTFACSLLHRWVLACQCGRKSARKDSKKLGDDTREQKHQATWDIQRTRGPAGAGAAPGSRVGTSRRLALRRRPCRPCHSARLRLRRLPLRPRNVASNVKRTSLRRPSHRGISRSIDLRCSWGAGPQWPLRRRPLSRTPSRQSQPEPNGRIPWTNLLWTTRDRRRGTTIR
jgi:hypothetical protein